MCIRDRYLKVSRLVKRRTLAKEVADKGRIEINGKVAKSSTDVKLGDELTLYYGNKILKVRVTDIKDSTKKQDAAYMYEIISEERIERPSLDLSLIHISLVIYNSLLWLVFHKKLSMTYVKRSIKS